MKTLLLAPNSFKECSDSVMVSKLFKSNLRDFDLRIIEMPISDGGDGFLSVCKKNMRLKELTYEITTPYDDSLMKCSVGLDAQNKTIYIESAKVLGMNIIPIEYRHPIELSSKGLGELLNKINADVDNGRISVEKIIIGIGGTGTNDLGLGACSVLGLKLFDEYGNKLKVIPENYYKAEKIEWEHKLNFNIEIVLDVDNPLLGKNGATYVYGPQKGSTNEELEIIESGFEKIIKLLKMKEIIESANNLSGAGGGLGAGLQIFFNASLKYSRDFINIDLGLQNMAEQVDYVITGEGVFDNQSFMNKGAGIIVDYFNKTGALLFLVCGRIDDNVRYKLGANVIPIQLSDFFKSKEESIKNFEKGIELASQKIKERIAH